MANKQFVIFTLDDEEFGIDITHVSIIEKPQEIFKIPNTPDFIEGVINLRGKVHTLINLRKRFGMDNKDFDDNTKFIIVNINTNVVGLIVDEVKEIETVSEDNIESTPDTLSNLQKKFIPTVAKNDEKVILIPDLESVVSF